MVAMWYGLKLHDMVKKYGQTKVVQFEDRSSFQACKFARNSTNSKSAVQNSVGAHQTLNSPDVWVYLSSYTEIDIQLITLSLPLHV
jgi:hypothetical protein